jgi:diguanylate cyclase (GGDEF)-like protein/PAS domain S-box-containing protein
VVFFARTVIVISSLIILSSLFDFFYDNTLIRIFQFGNEGKIGFTIDVVKPILEISVMLWILIAGKRVISQIQDENEQYKRLIQFSPEAMFVHYKGKILFINDSGANLLGSKSVDELIGRNISEFIHPDSKDFFNTIRKNVDRFPDRDITQNIKIKRVDGAVIDLEYNSTRIDFGKKSAREVIARDITVQKSEMEGVKRLAYEDELTGLPNRRAFTEALTQLVKTAKEQKMMVSVMFIDLDGFKQVNDSLGHDSGDIVLQHASDYFKKCVGQKGTVARLGGDEFTILLQDVNQSECVMIANKIIEMFRTPLHVLGKEVSVTPSIGIAIYPEHGEDAAELVKNADIAMYEAKQQGKNRYQLYTV